jgi:hypothetical protein
MVLIDIYGKIEPMIISEKLGVSICNPDNGWTLGFQDDFKEEILIHSHAIEMYKKRGMDTSIFKGRYNLKNIVEKLGWREDDKSEEQIIAEHLIEMQVLDFDNSLLQKKNTHLDSPTCEEQYTVKFLMFCQMVMDSKCANKGVCGQIPFITYDSERYNCKPLIINYLDSRVRGDEPSNIDINKINSISALQKVGKLIDGFLDTEEDFWLFDYIVDAVSNSNTQGAYQIFKIMSLIEMLIINDKNGKTHGKMEKNLPQFLPERIEDSKRELFADIMRKFRNKIGHGDINAVKALLEQYRENFMMNFGYDEFEYSIDNWIYGNICINVNETLNNILWLMISDKKKWEKIRKQ